MNRINRPSWRGHHFDFFVPGEPTLVRGVRFTRRVSLARTGEPAFQEKTEAFDRQCTRLMPSVATNSKRGGIMLNYSNHDTAARFRERAAECVRLAAASIDVDVEAQYRTLAEQYVKLAECEEVVFQEGPKPRRPRELAGVSRSRSRLVRRAPRSSHQAANTAWRPPTENRYEKRKGGFRAALSSD